MHNMRQSKLAIVLTLALALSGPAWAISPQEDDFEIKLRQVQPRQNTPTQSGPPGRATNETKVRVAPLGVVPLEFRSIRSDLDRNWHKAEAAAKEGLLDPYAFMEQLAGPLPVPPGARPTQCRTKLDVVVYTLGIGSYDTSSERRQSLLKGTETPETIAAMKKAEAFFLQHGFKRIPDPQQIGQWVYDPVGPEPEHVSLRIVMRPNGVFEAARCSYRGIRLPDGPVFAFVIIDKNVEALNDRH